jgi:hypothetical protein
MASTLLRAGGIELAKEVSAPLASVFALGGFAAWWVISNKESKKEDKGLLSLHVNDNVLKGIKIIDDLHAQLSTFGRDCEAKTCDDELSETGKDSPVGSINSRRLGKTQSLQRWSSSTSSTMFSSVDGDSEPEKSNFSQNRRNVSEPTISSGRIIFSENDLLDEVALSNGMGLHDRMISAIMQGNEAFVSAALDGRFAKTIDDNACDEFGNTFLILAVQVGNFLIARNYGEEHFSFSFKTNP